MEDGEAYYCNIIAGLDIVGAVVMKMVRPIKMLHSSRPRCCVTVAAGVAATKVVRPATIVLDPNDVGGIRVDVRGVGVDVVMVDVGVVDVVFALVLVVLSSFHVGVELDAEVIFFVVGTVFGRC